MSRDCALACLLLVALFATPLQAQVPQGLDCTGTGAPIAMEAIGGGPYEVYVAADSAAISRSFVLKDTLGRAIPNVDIEITLPDLPPQLMFYYRDAIGAFKPTPTPKRALVRTPSFCAANSPTVVAGPDAGTYIAGARVPNTEMSFTIPIRVLRDLQPIRREAGSPLLQVKADGASFTSSGVAEWTDGTHFGPLAGLPIRFTAPATRPTLVFGNGSNEITIGTDVLGVASAPGTIVGPPGAFDVRVTYPDGYLATTLRLVVMGAPVISLGDAPTREYGSKDWLSGIARFVGYPCVEAARFIGLMRPTIKVWTPHAELPASVPWIDGNCSDDVYSVGFSYSVERVPFGTHDIVAEMSTGGLLPAGRTPPSKVTIQPVATIPLARAPGAIRLGNADPAYPLEGGKCRLVGALSIAPSALPAPAPTGAEFPFGAVRFDLRDCTWEIQSVIIGLRPNPSGPIAQRILMELDQDLPPGTVAWAYGPTATNPVSHWSELRTSVVGPLAMVDVTDGGPGDDSLTRDSVMRPTIAIGVPKYATIPGSFQDLWWAGIAENGWGLSITQHGDTMFAAIFLYDANGDPRWLVVPGGTWNADRTQYTGNVYRPKGTPLAVSIAAGFRAGPPVGTARFTLTGRDTMTLDFTIDGVKGTKRIERQPFGPPHPYPAPRFDDLWWGGAAESGWGFALAQQYRTFFGVLYTYDANGDPLWFVAPAGSLSSPSSVTSRVYRTRGAPWLGVPYDPTNFTFTDVGSLKLVLRDGWESGALSGTISGWRSIANSVTRQPF